MMNEKRYFKVEYDEEWYLFDSNTISEEFVREQAEYGYYDVFANSLSPSEICELLNSLSEEKEKAELRENEILQKKLNSLYEDSVNEQNERFFGYDIGEYENMNYAVYDISKCEKKKEDFWDNEEECYDMRAYTEYLEENDCVLSCDEVVKKLNMVNQNCIILAKRLYEVEEESRERLRELQKWGLRYK